MELFTGIVPFVHVAEERSFRRAAEKLGLTAAAVSKAVGRLEAELGVLLLTRTSRHVALTTEGAQFLDHCRRAMDLVQAAREGVAQSQKVAQGTLRVSLSPVLGPLIVPRLGALLARHPRLEVAVSATDRFVRLAEEDVDVALRIGPLGDSALVARLLARPRWVTAASPAYLARRGTPRIPADLARHQCLKFLTPRGNPREWSFRPARGESAEVAVPGTVIVDHGELLVSAAVAGLGVCQAFDFMLAEHLRAGRLVEVLRERSAEGPPIHAVCLPRRQKTPKVRAFLDFAAQALREAAVE